MPNEPAQFESQHTDDVEIRTREAFYFRLFAGALCGACLTFGLLNLWGVIHV